MMKFCYHVWVLLSWWKEGIYVEREEEVYKEKHSSAWLKFAEGAEMLRKTLAQLQNTWSVRHQIVKFI